MNFCNTSAYDYDTEDASGQYSYSQSSPSNYLPATQPLYAMSGPTSPASMVQAGDEAEYGYPACTDECSNSAVPQACSDPKPHRSLPNAGSPGSQTLTEYVCSRSVPCSYQFQHREDDFWTYYRFHAFGENGPYWSLQDHIEPSEHYPRLIMQVDDPSRRGFSHEGAHRRFICLHPGCDGMFRRSADLERHVQQVHGSQSNLYYCDYRRCNRSRASPTNSPFGRKDHYRDHLREYHHEDLPRRRTSGPVVASSQRYIQPAWWRCAKCLARNYVAESGWHCAAEACNWHCEEDRKIARENKFLAPTAITN